MAAVLYRLNSLNDGLRMRPKSAVEAGFCDEEDSLEHQATREPEAVPSSSSFHSDTPARNANRPRTLLRGRRSLDGFEPAHWLSAGGLRAPDEPVRQVNADSLQEATLRGDIQLVMRQIDEGAPVNAPLRVVGGDEFLTLLHVIACKPDLPNGTSIAAELIYANADPDARSSLGSTPLMFACYHKHVPLAEVLLEAGANPDAIDDNGKTSLRYAVSTELPQFTKNEASALSVNLVMSLHLHGANLDLGGLVPPITEAIIQNNFTAMTQLLELGATSDGLAVALSDKPLKVVKELLAAGANPFARNAAGFDSMEVALQRNDEDVLLCLREYIADIERSRMPHLLTKKMPAPPQNTRLAALTRMLTNGSTGVHGMLFDLDGKSMHKNDETSFLASSRKKVRDCFRHPIPQGLLTTNVLLALFIPDLFTILDMQQDQLDTALVIILSVFVLEFVLQLFAFWRHYLWTPGFWIDLIGALSVPLDHSLVTSSFIGLFEGSGIARVTKFVKLGARAFRLSRLVKLLRFLPSSKSKHRLQDQQPQAQDKGTAKGISVELSTSLSMKVAVVIILMALIFPLMEFYRHPEADHSIGQWAALIGRTATQFPEEMPVAIEDMRQFYSVLHYYPYQVTYLVDNTTKKVAILGARVPLRPCDIFHTQSPGTHAVVSFNFRASHLIEAWLTVGLISIIIGLMFVASACVSLSVSKQVLKPMDLLLDIVQTVARKIFDALERMAIYFVKDYANKMALEAEEQDPHLMGMDKEISFLAKVLKKLSALNQIATAKRPVDEFEQLGDGQRAFLQDYATAGAVKHKHILDPIEFELDDEYFDRQSLMESIGRELDSVDMAREEFNNWEFNNAELNYVQRMSLARCLVIMYDTAPGFKDGSVMDIKRYSCHVEFLKALERGYNDEAVAYHNWLHVVDIAFSLRVVFHMIEAEMYLSLHERYALMVAALAHDVGHSGTNNAYLRESNHQLALLYNDQSCLQNMSCAKLFEITSRPDTAIFINYDKQRVRAIRQAVVSAILYTDLSKHFFLMAQMLGHYESKKSLFEYIEKHTPDQGKHDIPKEAFKEVQDFFWNVDVKDTVMNFLVQFADTSNSLKPWEMCSHWAELQFEEFFKQGDLERDFALPLQPLNDRARVNVAISQISFMKLFVVPQTILISRMLPPLHVCQGFMWDNLDRWVEKWQRSGPDFDEMQRVLDEVEQLKKTANLAPGQDLVGRAWQA